MSEVRTETRAPSAPPQGLHWQQLILDSADFTIIATDLDGLILSCNAGALKKLGYSAEEIVGKRTPIILHDREEVAERAAALSAELNVPVLPGFEAFVAKARLGITDENDWTYICKDGRRFPVRLSVTALRNEAGVIHGFLGIGKDITAQRNAEIALRQSERRIRSAVNASLDAVVIARPSRDASGRVLGLTVLDANARAESFSAVPIADLVGASFFDAFPHSQNTSLLEQCEVALRESRAVEIEQFAPLPTQPIRWLLRHLVPHIDGISVTSRDITERKLQEVALRESEAMLRGIIDGLEEGVLLHAPDGQVRLANKSAERIFGLSASELIAGVGRNVDWELTRDDGSPWRREDLPLARAMATGQYQTRVTLRVKRRDGTLAWLSIHAVPLIAPGELQPHAYISTFLDVTAQRALESQIGEAQKMQAIAKLAGGVAHDFNNVLAIIRGSVEFLEPHLASTAQGRTDIDAIVDASDHGARLTKQLLSVSQRQVLEMRPCNIGALLRNLEGELQAGMPERITLRIDVPEVDTEVRVDRTSLIDNVRILLTRAVGIIVGAGEVQLSVRTRVLSVAEAAARDVRPGPYTILSISDTGQSIDDQLKDRLFEPFSQSLPFGHQTGMELAALRGFVYQCQGFIEYESTRSLGSTFRMHFPQIVQPDGSASSPFLSNEPARASEGIQLALLVDDEPALRAVIARQLEQLGLQCAVAANAEEALELLHARGAEFTLLVADVTMPGMSGKDLASQAAALYPTLPIVLISGYAESPLEPADEHRNHVAFLAKPFSHDALRAVIETVQQNHSLRLSEARHKTHV